MRLRRFCRSTSRPAIPGLAAEALRHIGGSRRDSQPAPAWLMWVAAKPKTLDWRSCQGDGSPLMARGLLARVPRPGLAKPQSSSMSTRAGISRRTGRRRLGARSTNSFPDSLLSGYRMKGFGFRDHPSTRLQSGALRGSRSDPPADFNPRRDRRSAHDLLASGSGSLPANSFDLRSGIIVSIRCATLRQGRRGSAVRFAAA